MKGLTKSGFAVLCVISVSSIFGCGNAKEPEATGDFKQNPVVSAGPGAGVRKTGGATPDMSEAPAPAGVKTGVLPGGAK